eukprot:36022-Eustigmatos_ZCMA.PRE.1
MSSNGVHAGGCGGFFQIQESRELSALCQDRIERTTDPTNVVALLCRAHCICDEVRGSVLWSARDARK